MILLLSTMRGDFTVYEAMRSLARQVEKLTQEMMALKLFVAAIPGRRGKCPTGPQGSHSLEKKQITAVGAERAAVTVESLIDEAEQARYGAMEAGQYAAAVAAVKEKGVLSGKRVERRESGAPGEFAEIENMTAEQLADFIRKQAEESLH
jgi:hypothetical protein